MSNAPDIIEAPEVIEASGGPDTAERVVESGGIYVGQDVRDPQTGEKTGTQVPELVRVALKNVGVDPDDPTCFNGDSPAVVRAVAMGCLQLLDAQVGSGFTIIFPRPGWGSSMPVTVTTTMQLSPASILPKQHTSLSYTNEHGELVSLEGDEARDQASRSLHVIVSNIKLSERLQEERRARLATQAAAALRAESRTRFVDRLFRSVISASGRLIHKPRE